jgi:hypothetical protein
MKLLLISTLALLLFAVPALAATIEDFEDGNISEYTNTGAGAAVTNAAAHDGNYGLELTNGSGGWIYRDDAQVHNQQGDVVSYWAHTGGDTNRIYLGFGATAGGCYSAVIAPNTTSFIIQLNAGYGFADIGTVSQTWQANHWYRVEVHWGTGTIQALLFDSDGTTLLNTVNASDNTFTNGGLAFRGFVGAAPVYVDTIDLNGPTATLDTSWGRVKGLYR